MPDSRFKDQVAVVTGGASGIGLAIARRIASEGGHVVLWDRNKETLDQAVGGLGAIASGIEVDVANWESVQAAMAGVLSWFKKIDVLVHSAGITGPNATTWEYPNDDWARVLDINVNGTFHCNKAAVPPMLEAGYGRIVNIASVAGKEGNPNAPAYSASKAAVIGMTKSLGKELAKHPITVNCVTPAAIRTPLFDQMSQAHVDYMLSKVPMGRFGELAEVASMVSWLASKECSFSTGAVFDLSGGRATY